jgi:hypothetical protein
LTIDHSHEIKLGERYKEMTQMLSQTVEIKERKKEGKNFSYFIICLYKYFFIFYIQIFKENHTCMSDTKK